MNTITTLYKIGDRITFKHYNGNTITGKIYGIMTNTDAEGKTYIWYSALYLGHGYSVRETDVLSSVTGPEK